MSESSAAIPLGEAATQLGVTRLRLWRACKELGLAGTRNPVNRRQRLLQLIELERAAGALAVMPQSAWRANAGQPVSSAEPP